MLTEALTERGQEIQKKRVEVKPNDVVDDLNFANKVRRWHGTDRK